MLQISFRRHVKGEFSRLLQYWRVIEGGLKKAEQVNGAAVIPAINELRYASRQLYNAISTYGKPHLTEEDVNSIRKKLTVSEQYLLNADHDTVDGIINHYSKAIRRINSLYGAPEITIHYPEYPFVCRKIEECEALIRETRDNYDLRKQNYDKVRDEYFDYLTKSFDNLEKAEINAEYSRKKLERELKIKEGTINHLYWATVLGFLIGIIGLAFSVYTSWPF